MRCGPGRWMTDMRQRGGSSISNLRTAFRFAQWASSLPKAPTKLQVMDFLQCTGPMAVNWRNEWLANLPNPFPQNITGGNRTHTDQDMP
jgi:hypothetical protein